MCWLSWTYHYLAFYWMHDFSNELDVMLDSTQKSQSHFAARLKQRLVDEWVEEESNTSSVHLHALNFQTTARTKQALHGGSRYTVSILNWSRMYVVILLLLLLLCAIMLCAIMYAMRRFNFAFFCFAVLGFFYIPELDSLDSLTKSLIAKYRIIRRTR